MQYEMGQWITYKPNPPIAYYPLHIAKRMAIGLEKRFLFYETRIIPCPYQNVKLYEVLYHKKKGE